MFLSNFSQTSVWILIQKKKHFMLPEKKRMITSDEEISNIMSNYHWVKVVRIWSFSGPYFPKFGLNTERNSVSVNTPYLSIFGPNAGKYRLEKLQIRTRFMQCILRNYWYLNLKSNAINRAQLQANISRHLIIMKVFRGLS